METSLNGRAVHDMVKAFLKEDDLLRNFHYTSSLPTENVRCSLILKDNMVLAGTPFFTKVFRYLGASKMTFNLL